MRFIDLFAGLGGFHRALESLGHECVFASELDPELRELYQRNFRIDSRLVHGDIRSPGVKELIPAHDILCAGFPCQPFSKSGAQLGLKDQTRGTLFHEILSIVETHSPQLAILENVGNFERHDAGRTWRAVRKSLQDLGYCVRGTEHIGSGGHGLISPHHFGHPHHRERFFIIASKNELPADPFPARNRQRLTSLNAIVQPFKELESADRIETVLSATQVEVIEMWNRFLRALPPAVELPSWPIWSDEFGARYPFEDYTPFAASNKELRKSLRRPHVRYRDQLFELLPSYAQTLTQEFPSWKKAFIRQNRRWYSAIRSHLPRGWLRELRAYPASYRKLEWNCQGENRNLWEHVLQFRPSGLRVKRYQQIPALVAMTATQIPILGPQRRFLTRTEGLRLQGFEDWHELPARRTRAFAALGNAVHVDVVRQIARTVITRDFAPAVPANAQLEFLDLDT